MRLLHITEEWMGVHVCILSPQSCVMLCVLALGAFVRTRSQIVFPPTDNFRLVRLDASS